MYVCLGHIIFFSAREKKGLGTRLEASTLYTATVTHVYMYMYVYSANMHVHVHVQCVQEV